jgi:drug/metabolite transporter (DMT)-like permease
VIIQSGPVLILILSNLIFKDSISPRQILWIITVFVGVFLCAINLSDFVKQKISLDKGMKFAIAAPIMASFYFVFFRLFVNQYGWYWASTISFLTLPIGMFISKFFIKEDNKLILIKSKSIIFPAIMSALLIRGGDIALNLGLSMGFSATVTPIAGAAPILFVILSSIFFKDKISKQQIVGILITLTGIVGLSFFI